MGNLRVAPCTLAQANALVAKIHRHHKPVTGHRFSVACYRGPDLAAVAICGRPVARKTDQYEVLEILRCASDGTPNAISKLYGAICRAACAMGFRAVQTFTLPEEGGASLRASGFTFAGESTGRSWSVPSRSRVDTHPIGLKWKWVREFPQNTTPKESPHAP